MHQLRTTSVISAVAAGITMLAGCGSPATAPASGPATPAPGATAQPMPGMATPPAGGSAAAPGQDAPVATDAVTIQNFAFSPATVTVKTGTTVTWTNRDQDAHTVTATAGSFHSPTLNTGESFGYTFTTPGRVDYLCSIHPFMTATVVVTP